MRLVGAGGGNRAEVARSGASLSDPVFFLPRKSIGELVPPQAVDQFESICRRIFEDESQRSDVRERIMRMSAPVFTPPVESRSSDEGPRPLSMNRTVKACAVMCVDIVDSTNLFRKLEESGGSPSELLGRIFSPVQSIVQRHEGRVMDIVGDALIVVFWDLGAAPRAREAARQIVGCSENSEFNFHIGLAFGPVEFGDKNGKLRAIGYTVNQACHVASGRSGTETEDIGSTRTRVFADQDFLTELMR